MRPALVLLVLLLSACGNTTGDGRRTANIDKFYKARDACLARNAAADDISNSDPATLARAVALACSPETEQLVMAANRDGDAKVADGDPTGFRVQGHGIYLEGARSAHLLARAPGGSGLSNRRWQWEAQSPCEGLAMTYVGVEPVTAVRRATHAIRAG